MKNLKKVLALALSATMALSMFVSAGAAFTDQSDIKTTEAVDMLVALGVINGNPDGSFKPEGTVTRAEMAKMIYVARTGKDNADSYTSLSTSFKDITGHWAAGYIKYCQSMGIIAGKSATQFAPDALVTGTEAAKMLLVTAGYKADKAGLTGTGWDMKTLALAEETGLLDDVDAPMASGLPRQYAAQIVFNGINAEVVKYDGDEIVKNPITKTEYKLVEMVGTDGKTVTTIVPTTVSENETVGEKYLSLATAKTTMLDISYDSDKKQYTVNDEFKKIDVDYSNLMGQKIKVLYKKGDTSKVFGLYADPDSKVLATGSVGGLGTVTNDTKKIKLDSVEYKLDNELASVNYVKFNTSEAGSLSKLITDKADNSAYGVKLIDNDDNGKVDAVIVTPMTVGEVTYVGTTAATVGNKSYKFEDAKIYEGIKKDDWAVIVSGDYTAIGDPVITKADALTGKVTGTKSGEAQVDGKWYKLATGVTVNTNDTYDFAVVGSYIYNASLTTASSKDILYISGNKEAKDNLNNEYTAEARAYFIDGTSAVIKVNKIYDETAKKYKKVDPSANDAEKIKVAASTDKTDGIVGLYSYGKDSDGQYQLRAISGDNKAGYGAYTASALPGDSNKIGGKYAFADDAVVFVHANEEVKVLTGKTVKDWDKSVTSTKAMSLTKESNGIDYVKVSALQVNVNDAPGADGDKLYGYLTTDAYKGSNEKGDDAVVLKLWNGSAEETVYAESSTDIGLYEAGTAIAYTIKDGKNVNIKETLVAYAIKGFDGKAKGEMSLLNQDARKNATYTLDDDCVIIGIDDKNTKGTEGSLADVRLGLSEKKDYRTENAYIAFNTENKITAVIYDTVEGKLEDGVQITDETQYNVTKQTSGGATAGISVETNVSKAIKGEAVKVTVTCDSTAVATKLEVAATGSATVSPASRNIAAGSGTYTFEVTMGAADSMITVTCTK